MFATVAPVPEPETFALILAGLAGASARQPERGVAMMRTAFRIAVAAWAAALPFTSFAWGPAGHQAVGAIAEELLKGSPAALQVRAILGDVSLRQATVWADCAKGVNTSDDVTFTYHANNIAFPECMPFGSVAWKAAFESFVSRNWKQCGSALGSEKCHNQYHYSDISTKRDHYAIGEVGANTHDIAHSVAAAVEVLRGLPAPPPFDIADKREALLVLSHYVGDIHQPLHVEAVYLSAKGRIVDPDAAGLDPGNETAGGNSILDGTEKLHHEWDAIPPKFAIGGAAFDNLVAEARTIVVTSGEVSTWSTTWASDTVAVGHAAFTGLRYAPKATRGARPLWTVTGTHTAAYQARAERLKRDQLAKAGAHLAQLLEAIWPAAPP